VSPPKCLVAVLALACLALALPAASASAAGTGGICADCDEPDEPGRPDAEQTPTPGDDQLSLRQLRRLTRDLGFRKPRVAAAIAMAESSGDPLAVGINRKPRSRDRGLFQINSRWHPEVSDRCAFDVRCNAEEAYRISEGGRDWRPWSTWHNGAYKQYL
jgi:hypothetical protein